MASLSSAQTALLILLGLSIVYIIVRSIKNAQMFHGYEEVRTLARKLASTISGDIFRDKTDLVIAANYGRFPVAIRFSNAVDTPAFSIRMQAPANFNMYAASKSAPATEGRQQIRSGDAMFDARFNLRTDNPSVSQMYLGSRVAVGNMVKLCCSSKTFLLVVPGSVELREMALPEGYPVRHILDHLGQMNKMALALDEMPGAEAVKIVPIRKPTRMGIRAVIVIGVIAAVATVWAGKREQLSTKELAPEADNTPAGILPVDAAQIPRIEGWRIATDADYGRAENSWLRGMGVEPGGRVEGDFSGQANGRDVGYILIGPDGSRRIVLLVDGVNRFDGNMPMVAVAARIPKRNFGAIEWVGNTPPAPDGDGFLVVRALDDASSGLIMFMQGQTLVTGVPLNYQTIRVN